MANRIEVPQHPAHGVAADFTMTVDLDKMAELYGVAPRGAHEALEAFHGRIMWAFRSRAEEAAAAQLVGDFISVAKVKVMDDLTVKIAPNSLIEIAASDRHDTCCAAQKCRACGSHVSTYNANGPLIGARPEASEWDWWVACDNADCEHAYGEGLFQELIEWIAKDPER